MQILNFFLKSPTFLGFLLDRSEADHQHPISMKPSVKSSDSNSRQAGDTISVRPEWTDAKRIVVKLGSALLTSAENGELQSDWLASLLDDVAALKKAGKEVVLVSSGSVALGRQALGFEPGPLALEASQAAAAVGQISLAHAYQKLSEERGLIAAQILVTLGDTEERRRYLNARDTILNLLRLGTLPVVNENDSVATVEIRYGDNDRLSARVASMIDADCLVLLSDIDGLYTAPPYQDSNARHIDVVEEITPEIMAMAGDAGTSMAKGGMRTKIEAAKVALAAGTDMVIMSGIARNPLSALTAGARCTWFLAPADPVTSRKRWLSGQLEPKGTITVDAGAESALQAGKSLLPAGVTDVSGVFDRGDAVIIESADGRELGRGLIAYNNRDALLIKGQKSHDIPRILGFEGRAELVHRDVLAVTRT